MKRIALIAITLFALTACEEPQITDLEHDVPVVERSVLSSCVHYVDPDVATQGDGRSWDTAYLSLNDAITSAKNRADARGEICEVWYRGKNPPAELLAFNTAKNLKNVRVYVAF